MSAKPASSNSKSEKEAFEQRENLKNYERGVSKFQSGGKQLQSSYPMKASYTKLNFIHYAVILSILLSIILFSLFLVLTYIPITKPYVMKLIETLLIQ